MSSSSCPSLLPSPPSPNVDSEGVSMALLPPSSSPSIMQDETSGSFYSISRLHCVIITLVVFSLIIITALLAFFIGHSSAYHRETQHVDLLSSSEPGSLLDLWAELEKKNEARSNHEECCRGVDDEMDRLPKHLIPQHYHILFNLSLTAQNYLISGKVDIHLFCRNTSRTIVFHASKNVQVLDAHLRESFSGRQVQWISLQRQSKSHIFILRLNEQLKESTIYILSIQFQSRICQGESGVHCFKTRNYHRWKRSLLIDDFDEIDQVINWKTINNTASKLSTQTLSLMTKFEPALARSLIPCWDEPQFKAVFNITVVHPPEMEVLTNTAAAKRMSNEHNEYVTSSFYETPPMSTYLLALASGPLVSSQTETQHGITLSIWSLPEDSYRTRFALEYSSHMFDVIEQYFVVPYPLSKLDLVASRNFPVGGMENWGLIVFHHQVLLHEDSADVDHGSGYTNHEDQNTILLDPVNKLLQKFKSSKLIIHELLHQWFGNIVTMQWWDDLWLNEGFATFYTQHFLSKSYPLLVESEYYLTLARLWKSSDPLAFKPLATQPTSDDSLEESFHWTTYAKSCIVVEMLYNLLGERTLRGGIVEYLRAYVYKSVNRQDLWDKLGEVVHFGNGHVEIGPVMEPWIIQGGIPEVHIKRNYREGNVVVSQKTTQETKDSLHDYFVPNSKTNKNDSVWSIPFAYVSNRNPRLARPFWIMNHTFEFTDMDLPMGRWMLANPNFQFPYRVNYDRKNWRLLIDQLHSKFTIIPMKSRVQLLMDSAHFTLYSNDLQLHLHLLAYLKKETELLPVLIGVQELWHVLNTFRSTNLYELVAVHYRPVINNMLERRNQSVHIVSDAKEEKAVWKLAQHTAEKLDQLSCAINHVTCRMSRKSIHQILANPVDGHIQGNPSSTCAFIRSRSKEEELEQLVSILDKWTLNSGSLFLQVAACSSDDRVVNSLVNLLLNRRGVSAGIIINLLSNPLTLDYNKALRLALWKGMLELEVDEKRRLLGRRSIGEVLLRSIGSLEELRLASKLIPGFLHLKESLREKLTWIELTATPKCHNWLLRNLKLIN